MAAARLPVSRCPSAARDRPGSRQHASGQSPAQPRTAVGRPAGIRGALQPPDSPGKRSAAPAGSPLTVRPPRCPRRQRAPPVVRPVCGTAPPGVHCAPAADRPGPPPPHRHGPAAIPQARPPRPDPAPAPPHSRLRCRTIPAPGPWPLVAVLVAVHHSPGDAGQVRAPGHGLSRTRPGRRPPPF